MPIQEMPIAMKSHPAILEPHPAHARHMTGHDDGIGDTLLGFTRPLTGGFHGCPAMAGDALDLSAPD